MTSPQELPLDHIVIAVADLARTIIDYRALGLPVVQGAKQPGRTSQNDPQGFEDAASPD